MKIKGILVGCGYFSQFHMEAWQRMPEVELVALCDADLTKAAAFAERWRFTGAIFSDLEKALARVNSDFVDIATPPASHLELVRLASTHGRAIICQKPLAPTLKEAEQLVTLAHEQGVRLMVHENFRFQPWHRAIRQLLDEKVVGDRLYSIYWRMRMGDGWQPDAYKSRQPYFRTYPRLLIYETGVHLIDVVRFLSGSEVVSVAADLTRRNPEIAGEDSGLVVLTTENGSRATLDMSRYNESRYPNPRYTFADSLLLDLNGGSIELTGDGAIRVRPLGQPAYQHHYEHHDRNFAGDCVYFCQRHFVDCLLHDQPFETSGKEYLQNLDVQEKIYKVAGW
ncbi:Gfo/Idh/MocA family oxidoreductase [Telluribacter sp.]|jgi:predicted dehydrogenase|uniref:Gfo/Idh/MocA family protein n=1 Tax=Telluribacter sp. TaxID=1978767 RepID=UPI002E0D7F28|nr:Gfo/Idh/MocA family oxidoreductase [Telluribacter sp.]